MLMTSVASEWFDAKFAALHVRFGLLAVEVAALSFEQMPEPPYAEDREPAGQSMDAQIDAAAGAIKTKLLTGREAGFRNMLQTNSPNDEIKAMAEAALKAARRMQ